MLNLNLNDYVVVLDPGVRKAGIAIFYNKKLIRAQTIQGDPVKEACQVLHEVITRHCSARRVARPEGAPPRVAWIVEEMTYYDQRSATHDNLDDVEAMVARLRKAVRPRGWKRVKAFAWKRNVSKSVTAARAREELAPTEEAYILDDGHDALDAVAMGLVMLGRLGPGCVKMEEQP